MILDIRFFIISAIMKDALPYHFQLSYGRNWWSWVCISIDYRANTRNRVWWQKINVRWNCCIVQNINWVLLCDSFKLVDAWIVSQIEIRTRVIVVTKDKPNYAKNLLQSHNTCFVVAVMYSSWLPQFTCHTALRGVHCLQLTSCSLVATLLSHQLQKGQKQRC